MYEYAFLLDADLRRRTLRHRVPITLLTPEPYPGHVGLDQPLAREDLARALQTQEIHWIGNAALHHCDGRRLHFEVHDNSAARPRGHEPALRSLEFAYAMIWPPCRGIEAVTRCPALCDQDGLIVVDDYQRARGQSNVFAVGACAAKPLLKQVRADAHSRLLDELQAQQQRVRFEGGAP